MSHNSKSANELFQVQPSSFLCSATILIFLDIIAMPIITLLFLTTVLHPLDFCRQTL